MVETSVTQTAADNSTMRPPPRIPVPRNLLLAYARLPEVIAVYVLIGRLVLRAQGPVPVSSRDLVVWLHGDAALRSRLLRALQLLVRDGWLLRVTTSHAKAQFIPSWSATTPAPWRSDAPQHGRPLRTRLEFADSAIVDAAFGELHPRAVGRAPVTRHYTLPLLTLHDLGVLVLSQIVTQLLPPRLQHYRRTSGTLATLAATWDAHAAAGTLTTLDADGQCIKVTDWMPEAEQVCAGQTVLPTALPGPPDVVRPVIDFAAAPPTSVVVAVEPTSIDVDGARAPVHDDPPADAHVTAALAMHAALNARVVLPPGERHEIAALVAQYGSLVLIWQARCWRAGQDTRRITPDYYRVCAAPLAICAAHTPPVAAVGPCPDVYAAAADVSSTLPAPHQTPDARVPQLAAQLSAAYGTPVRSRRQLRAAPHQLVAAWCAVADHPGMQRWGDPLGYALSQIARGHAPPTADVLDRWVDQRDPRMLQEQAMTFFRTTGTNRASRAEVVRAQVAAQLDPAQQVLWEHILLDVGEQDVLLTGTTDASCAAVDGFAARVTAVIAALGWSHSVVIGDLAPRARADAPPCAPPPPQAAPPVHPDAPPAPPVPGPSWIDPAVWATLSMVARAALRGTTLQCDGTLVGGNLTAMHRLRLNAHELRMRTAPEQLSPIHGDA